MLIAAFLLSLSPGVACSAVADDRADEIILSVQAGRYNLSPAILAYEYDGRYYVPVMALSSVFEFYSVFDPAAQIITGWALEEKNKFSLDFSRHSLWLGHKEKTLPENFYLPKDAVDHPLDEGDVYVGLDILNEIWPLDLAVNPENLSLDVQAQDNLPFIKRAERKKRYSLLDKMRGKKQEHKNLISQPNKYQLYSPPVLDLEARIDYDRQQGGFGGRVALSGVQDLLWMSANYTAIGKYYNGHMAIPDYMRLRFDRDSGQGDKLPFGLEHIELGDTRLRHAPLIKNSTYGRGILLSSAKRKRDFTFDMTTVEGAGPPGWDAELYRNNSLLAFSAVDEKGEYRFENVELNFGDNVIRVLLYGPQGQMREIVENYSFGSDMLAPGRLNYTLGVVDAEKDLISFNTHHNRQAKGAAMNADIAYGFNHAITGSAAFASLPEDRYGKGHDYASLGVSANLGFGALQVEAYQEMGKANEAGRALDTRFITALKGIKVNLRHTLYDGHFESPDAGYGQAALSRETEIGLQNNRKFAFGTLGLSFDYKTSRLRNGHEYSRVGTQQSLSYNGLRLAHNTQSYFGDGQDHALSGQLSATARVKKFRLRSSVNYNALPDKKIQSFDGEIFYRASDKLSASILARHDFPLAESGAGFQLNYIFDHFIGSLEALWEEKSGAQLILRASTAFGPYGNDGSYIMRADRLAGISAARARVFLDRNQDGIYDEGDLPLDHARIRVNARNDKQRSDQDGILVNLSGAGVEDAVIELDAASLQDPYHIPAHDGFLTSLRPGSLPHFDFPVIETGAVDGTAYRSDGQAAQGLLLELVNASGVVVQKTESAYDGFYTFEHVPAGQYHVRPAVGQADSTGMMAQYVEITAESFFMSGIDLSQLSKNPLSSITGTAIVENVDINEGEDSVLLVLALSSPSAYHIQRSENGRMIFIDFPDIGFPATGWKALRAWRGSPDAILAGYDVEPLNGGGTRLKLAGKKPILLDPAKNELEGAGFSEQKLSFSLVSE